MELPSEAGAVSALGVAQRIQARRPQMSGAMAKIAALLVEHPTAPLELSITELAARAGTSAATVTRFCRLIGYSGYVPLRVGVAADVGRGDVHASWHTDIGREFDPEDSPSEVLHALLSAHTRSVQATASSVDLEQVDRIATAIATSRHLDIYGIGGSGLMAVELQSRLYRIGLNAHAWTEVHDGIASAAIQDESSVALGISNTGRTDATIQMLSQARSSGAFTVALTNSPDSPLAAVAHEHVVAAAPEEYLQPDDLSAKHSQLFLLDLVYLLVAQQDFARTTTKLAASAMAVLPHRRSVRSRARRSDTSVTSSDTSGNESHV
ncbi:MurR/RpiR family transcriptional regulator [Mumia zhuanghuii]|uniref:MurR/RpiR family transcriptional regulator n=2 Tax=Mumia TaxID=1546255 RepID=A0ABW1QPK7_9ACTN|nr:MULTISPECIES: MurR/RpiR family transcriptional regulator [Mumia]KAA1424423.1 MurR/RpiR family transcriptional regulator [Mumia zhuanghuii]